MSLKEQMLKTSAISIMAVLLVGAIVYGYVKGMVDTATITALLGTILGALGVSKLVSRKDNPQ